MASFLKDELHVSWQAQHFRDLHRQSAWKVQRFTRVLQARHFVTFDFCDGSLARSIDFEVATFQVLRKTHGKTLVLKLQSVNKV